MRRLVNKNYNLFLIAISFVTAFSVISYTTFLDIRSKLAAEIESQLNNSLSKVENSFVDTIKHTEYVMKMLNNQVARNPQNPSYLNNLISKFRIDPISDGALPWTMFAWVDNKNRLTVDGLYGVMEDPQDLSTRDYIPKLREYPNIIHLGKPVFGIPSNKWVIPAGVGYVDDKGKYLGATVIGFDLNLMSKSITRKIGSEDIDFIVTDGKRNLYIDSQKIEQGPKYYEQNLLRIIDAYVNSNSTEPSYNILLSGEQDSYVIKKVPGFDFFIAVKYNGKLVSSAAKSIFIDNLPKIIFILMLFTFVGYLILRERKLKTTTQKLHSETIKQAKAKNEFLAYTGHELRSPLNGIMFGSEMIMKKVFGDIHPKYLEYVQDMHQNGQDLLHFIEDLIDATRAEDGNFSLNKEAVDIDECVKRVVNLNAARAHKSGIKIETYIEKGIPELQADPKRLRQILNNLISNSIKYSADGSHIKIIVHSIDELTQIIVEDQGFGMTEDELQVALSKYGTVVNANSDKVESIGLGLPLVKNLVEAHGARFEIESHKGAGTRVTISFPLHKQVKNNIIPLKKA